MSNNVTESYLVVFPICPIRFANLTDFNRSFIPSRRNGSFSEERLFGKAAKTSEENKQDLPLFFFLALMTIGCVNVFWLLGRIESF